MVAGIGEPVAVRNGKGRHYRLVGRHCQHGRSRMLEAFVSSRQGEMRLTEPELPRHRTYKHRYIPTQEAFRTAMTVGQDRGLPVRRWRRSNIGNGNTVSQRRVRKTERVTSHAKKTKNRQIIETVIRLTPLREQAGFVHTTLPYENGQRYIVGATYQVARIPGCHEIAGDPLDRSNGFRPGLNWSTDY